MHTKARRKPRIRNSQIRRNETEPKFLMGVQIIARKRTRRERRRPNAPISTRDGIQRVHA